MLRSSASITTSFAMTHISITCVWPILLPIKGLCTSSIMLPSLRVKIRKSSSFSLGIAKGARKFGVSIQNVTRQEREVWYVLQILEFAAHHSRNKPFVIGSLLGRTGNRMFEVATACTVAKGSIFTSIFLRDSTFLIDFYASPKLHYIGEFMLNSIYWCL